VHNFLKDIKLLNTLETNTLNAYFYNNFVVVEVSEGVNLNFKSGFSLLLKGLQIHGTRPFIYISNRINSYSLNPNDYKYLEKIPTLKGLAIVSNSKDLQLMAKMESQFFVKKPFEMFDDIQNAHEWGEMVLSKDFSI